LLRRIPPRRDDRLGSKAASIHHLIGVRTRRERPCHGRAAEQRDERAPF
jgi:hypothetical protein